MKHIEIIVFFCLIITGSSYGQWANKRHQTLITPFRFTLPPTNAKVEYEDLDGDGDPDILRTLTNGDIPVLWIDDDDDMKKGDLEGDTDSDCLVIDKNKDGFFGHDHDVMIDWGDEDGDNVADIQVFVETGGCIVATEANCYRFRFRLLYWCFLYIWFGV
ncbi:hypothetical protein KFZ70_09390 [Tamlana fucoidanivorans]|uniref:VCBS repeat-containing protein n=1 Tax=Allotamlana fucoidanivorans TaxID=2583814 RepID=A0A5C4SQH1_9FLAO|nr:hypothetical protein [Tamlana fucoidanivorans]TNJ46035.1 hypothetical protein FGF67_03295 [Tamlana fucoidanivorans]